MDEKIVNSLKGLSIDMIHEAGSGHPGIALGAAPIIYTLYCKHMNISLENHKWMNRDRFVLSAGHASALLYSMLYYCGYLSIDNLKKFRCLNSLTPGHPEIITPGVDMSTGPLGEGIASAVGMAIAEKYYEASLEVNMIDHYTYVLCGDGDLMEGVSYEACSLAGTLKLGKLIVLYDSNNISLDGNTIMTFDEDIKMRFESMGWNYIKVEDGNSILEIDKAITMAKEKKNMPTIIEIKTVIGNGSLKENSNVVHGTPLSDEDISQLKLKLGLDRTPFVYDTTLVDYFRDTIKTRCDNKYKEWNEKYSGIEKIIKNKKIDLLSLVNPFYEEIDESMRDTNGKIMNIIGTNMYTFIGGAADTSTSNKTSLHGKGTFSKINYSGKNICYGVREHAMGAISNGLALSGLKPFASTFLVFSDYLKPAIRMSALMNLPITYVFTHDSIMIGKDGATHQPIEELTMLRSIPNFRVFRPADANEILGSWNEILNNPKPSAIVLSRDSVPLLKESDASNVSNGAYIVKRENGRLSGIIIATGSEVNIAVKVAEALEKEKVHLRVVSMPCMSLYESNTDKYKESILPAGYKKIVIEYGDSYSWYRYVYNDSYLININEFGKSGEKNDVLKYFKLDYESILKRIKEIIK